MTCGISDLSNPENKAPVSLSVNDALKTIPEVIAPVAEKEEIPLLKAAGRIAAEDIVSPVDVPGFDNAAMDGFAFSAEGLDLSQTVSLDVAGFSSAGHPFAGKMEKGQCVRIMTGALMPSGCDTVVQQENVRTAGFSRIELPPGAVDAGANVRKKGENIAKGTAAVKKGTVLRPAHIGLLASLGFGKVPVRRKVKVAVFSTGDELQLPGTLLKEGAIYDSNRATVIALAERLGCDVIDMGIVSDNPEELKAALQKACRKADAVITSGGVSVGVADYTKQVMAEIGDIAFWSVKLRPGRPMAFGKIFSGDDSAFLFGLPGNPVAVMVSFYFFVRDALLHLMGASPSPLIKVRVKAAGNLSKRTGRTEFQRGIAFFTEDGVLSVKSTGEQGSGILRSMTDANCIIVLPEEAGKVRSGDDVDIVLMDGLV